VFLGREQFEQTSPNTFPQLEFIRVYAVDDFTQIFDLVDVLGQTVLDCVQVRMLTHELNEFGLQSISVVKCAD